MSPLSIFVSILLLASTSVAKKKPSDYFHLCSLGDPKLNACIKKSMIESGPLVMKGIPEMKWPQQDPFFLPKVEMDRSEGNFAFKVALTNLTVTGQKDHALQNVRVNKQFTQMNFTSKVPKIIMDGDYSMNGLIVRIPVTGNGHMHIDVENVLLNGYINYEHFEENGEKYFRIKDVKWDIKPANVKLNFTNLFNGDKALGDATNNFFNENWKEAYVSFKDLHEDVFSKIFKEYTNKILTSYPMRDWFD